jgi:four helix bundle protein
MPKFQDELKLKMDEYVHLIYKLTKEYPKAELYGVVSQIRRSSLSVILNYIEGFARRKRAVQINFLEISYGSLKESKYLLYFSLREGYIDKDNYNIALKLADEIGAMLWTEMKKIEEKHII